MDLKQKLARLGPIAAGGASVATVTVAARAPERKQEPVAVDGESPSAASDKIRRGLSLLSTARKPTPPPPVSERGVLHGVLPVVARATATGTIHVRAIDHDPDHRHGRVRLSDALAVQPGIVSQLALDPVFEGVDPSRMLLLDLETTGLSGGTGTLPIVVGLAWFEAGRLRMEQLFLRRPGEERPMLGLVAERLAAASCVVTYNGKTFDWPLLRSRFVMNRTAAPAPPPHLDLLHCARRIFKWRGAGARLADIEREVIGHRRHGDVDGAEIPERYFRYLRSGNAAPLVPVLDHNVHDVRLLAALLAHLCQRFTADDAADAAPDLLGFAHLAERNRADGRALHFARAAVRSAQTHDDPAILPEALVLSARVALRAGDARGAVTALERALQTAKAADRAPLHLALAKLYEHRLRDVTAALQHAVRSAACVTAPEHTRRLQRLERKVSLRLPGL